MGNLKVGDRVSVDRAIADALVDTGAYMEVESQGAFVLIERVAL